MMHIDLVFEDFHHSANLIGREFAFLNKGINDVKSEILNDFKAAFKELGKLHPVEFQFNQIKIQFILDKGEEHKDTLAYFNYVNTARQGAYFFGIYYETVKEYLIAKWRGDSDFKKRYDGIWQHEIIHMLDFASISHFSKEYKSDFKFVKKPSLLSRHFDETQKESPSYWYLLNLLNLMRVEGIATLYECMCGYMQNEITTIEILQKNLAWSINTILHFISMKDSRNFHTIQELNEQYKIVTAQCYQNGKWLVLKALADKKVMNAEKVFATVLQNGNFICEEDSRIAIMKEALNLDLSDFILQLLQPGNLDKQVVDTNLLLQHVSLMTENEVYRDINSFVMNIYSAASRNDASAFSETLKEIIGVKMKSAEIDEHMKKFYLNNDQNNFVEKQVFEKIIKLYDRWRQEPNNDAIGYALTYVLDEKDLIDDGIEFLGYLDDLFVLEGIETLTNKTAI